MLYALYKIQRRVVLKSTYRFLSPGAYQKCRPWHRWLCSICSSGNPEGSSKHVVCTWAMKGSFVPRLLGLSMYYGGTWTLWLRARPTQSLESSLTGPRLGPRRVCRASGLPAPGLP